jgi:DNA repair exonuclease SbcCD ATPase subunit
MVTVGVIVIAIRFTTDGSGFAPAKEVLMRRNRSRVGAALLLSGSLVVSSGAAFADENDWWRGWWDTPRQRELRSDRREIQNDKEELREDRQDYRDAKRELRRDRRQGASEREIARDLRELRDEKAEIREGQQELKEDRRDLRHNRR